MSPTADDSPGTVWRTVRGADPGHPFAEAIHNDEWVLVTGVGGHDPYSGDISDDTAEQTRQTIRNVGNLLRAAGSSWDEVVQLRPYVTHRSYALAMDHVLSAEIDDPRPASGALVICQLIDERMHVEIEVVAHRGARRWLTR